MNCNCYLFKPLKKTHLDGMMEKKNLKHWPKEFSYKMEVKSPQRRLKHFSGEFKASMDYINKSQSQKCKRLIQKEYRN